MIKRKLITAGFVIAMAAMVMSGCKSGGTDKETTAAAAGETAGSQESGTASGETKSEEELTDEASLELGNYKGLTLTAVKAGVTDEDLEAELENLKTVRRKDVAEKIKEARGQGDLSENAEYDAAKEAQGLLEMKINKLKQVIADAKIIDESKLKTDSVQILNKVELKNVKNGMKMTYTIVSESEANLKEGKISVNTPIAQGLLGKKVGDVAEIKVPQGIINLEVVNISF